MACDAGSSSGSCCSCRLANHGAATCSRCFVCTGCSDGCSWSSSVSVSPMTPADSDAQNCGASATTAPCATRGAWRRHRRRVHVAPAAERPRHANGLPSSAAPKVAVRRQTGRRRVADARAGRLQVEERKSISCGATSFTSPAKVSCRSGAPRADRLAVLGDEGVDRRVEVCDAERGHRLAVEVRAQKEGRHERGEVVAEEVAQHHLRVGRLLEPRKLGVELGAPRADVEHPRHLHLVHHRRRLHEVPDRLRRHHLEAVERLLGGRAHRRLRHHRRLLPRRHRLRLEEGEVLAPRAPLLEQREDALLLVERPRVAQRVGDVERLEPLGAVVAHRRRRRAREVADEEDELEAEGVVGLRFLVRRLERGHHLADEADRELEQPVVLRLLGVGEHRVAEAVGLRDRAQRAHHREAHRRLRLLRAAAVPQAERLDRRERALGKHDATVRRPCSPTRRGGPPTSCRRTA